MNKRLCRLLLRIIISVTILAVLCVTAIFCVRVKKHREGNVYGTRAVFQDRSAVVSRIRQCLVSHSSRIRLSFSANESYRDDAASLIDELMREAYEPTGNPCEGDYIRYQTGGYTVSYGGSDTLTEYKNDIYIEPVYYTSLKQESAVRDKVEEILDAFAFDENTGDYEKVRAVYDYLVENVSYDTVHEKNDYYHLNATAYAALVNKNASCQGFCVAMERLLLECGVSCRIVTGDAVKDGISEYHSWNLVCIDGLYYNVDVTWARVLDTDEYFLRCDENFANHVRADEFAAEEFYKACPMSDEDYQIQ